MQRRTRADREAPAGSRAPLQHGIRARPQREADPSPGPDDRIDLDGYEVLRTADITAAADRFPRQAFYAKALELKGIGPDREPPVDIADMPRAVESIGRRFPLVSVSRERAHPDEIAVGRVCGVRMTGFALQWITPSAVLEARSAFHRFAGITRLQFGGEYERTLALVAGLSPAL